MRRARPGSGIFIALVLAAMSGSAAFAESSSVLENNALRLTFSPEDGSITVLDKRDNLTWSQQVESGFHGAADSIQSKGNSISARVVGPHDSYNVTIALSSGSSASFDFVMEIPGRHYTWLPGYPFHFKAPAQDWYYVQNTSGEGLLMPLNNPGAIHQPYSWNGSQPWWGLTDLKRAFAVRLDSFRNVFGRIDSPDLSAYGLPMRLHYDFFADGGYVALAKSYRGYFLANHPGFKPLQDRVANRPPVGALKDSVYVYLWGSSPAEDLELVSEMKSAGIDHGIAVFYGRHPVDRPLFDGIKRLGWVAGLYHMPTGNLFRVTRHRGWVNELLTGEVTREQVFRTSDPRGWDRVCAKYLLPEWLEKARTLINSYGVQLFYFDTLANQLAPCLSPQHPSTIEENEQARLELMQKTQQLGTVVGTGEGLCPTWALPGVDYFEGLMSLRSYADPRLHIPGGDYGTDLGNSYASDAAIILDPTRRIPLYELAFHDYVAGTWVWRDTNFQSRPFAHQKDLFNILYGTMPMWHIDRRLWQAHKDDYVASYRAVNSVRARIGFAQMTNHGCLTSARDVQFSDWDTGDRVIVNFGNHPYERKGQATIPPGGFAIEKTER